MKVNGIIAEYNPFHNGHLYHLETVKERTKADYTVVVMSGNFVQRGAPALLPKHTRAEMALKCGADLVLELPAYYAAGSAEFFAAGAVALLDRLGMVDFLCFGSECGQTRPLMEIASILAEEPPEYGASLRRHLKEGLSFPRARAMALTEQCPSLADTELLSSPNNLLGTEYCKALLRRGSGIRPVTIRRLGADYHQEETLPRFPEDRPSALFLRKAILSHTAPESLRRLLPPKAFSVLSRALEEYPPLESDDFSLPLYYKLLTDAPKGYRQYLDVSSELSERILGHLDQFESFDTFCESLKTKGTTYTRISRCLIHILLQMETEKFQQYQALDLPYARVLGLRKSASPLLSAIKQNTSIPLISKSADADKLLGPEALAMFREDLSISHIYNAVEAYKANTGRHAFANHPYTKRTIRNEYRTSPVVLP